MNKEIIPNQYSMDMKEKHSNSKEWNMFARKIQKNPFVKNYLLNRDEHKCRWCDWNINDGFLIHHIEYDHTCEYKVMTEYPNPTPKRPNRTVKVPDCESCSIANPEAFASCMSKLATVHKLCNLKIEDHY